MDVLYPGSFLSMTSAWVGSGTAAVQADIQRSWRYSVGVQVEGENIWKGKVSPRSCLMTKKQGKACRDISSHQYKTTPRGQGPPCVRGTLRCPSRLAVAQWPMVAGALPPPPPGSTVCCLLFKHSSCLSTTLALQGWSYLIEKKKKSPPPPLPHFPLGLYYPK